MNFAQNSIKTGNEDLPKWIVKEEICGKCDSQMNLDTAYLDDDESRVITWFKCTKCDNRYGLAYWGGYVGLFKKHVIEGNKPEPKTPESIMVG